jgi:hypothetical protein
MKAKINDMRALFAKKDEEEGSDNKVPKGFEKF